MGEMWGVFREYLWENWLRYNRTALYLQKQTRSNRFIPCRNIPRVLNDHLSLWSGLNHPIKTTILGHIAALHEVAIVQITTMTGIPSVAFLGLTRIFTNICLLFSSSGMKSDNIYIGAQTKWLMFCKQHFQMHSLERKCCMYFDSNVTDH